MLTIYSLNYLFYRVNVNHSPLAKCSNSCLYSAWMGILLWTWNFQGYQRNSMWNFQGFLKNEVEFWRSIKKKCCGISRGLSFWSWNFQGIQHNFVEYPGAENCFVWNFQFINVFLLVRMGNILAIFKINQ